MSRITDAQAVVLAAVIGVVGIFIGAIMTPLAKTWFEVPSTPESPKSLPIEQLPASIFPYDGRDENIGGWTKLSVSYENSAPNYNLEYFVPSDQAGGYAGIAFRFTEEGQNLSEYQRIEFTIQFDDAESKHEIDICIADISDKKICSRLASTGGTKRESHLLTNFSENSGVSLNAIGEISFNAHSSFVTGNHNVTLSDVRFVP